MNIQPVKRRARSIFTFVALFLVSTFTQAAGLLQPSGRILALIKPQFEAGRTEASRGRGVIRDPAIHRRVLAEIEAVACDRLGLVWHGATESPIMGPAGNKEFIAFIEYADDQP